MNSNGRRRGAPILIDPGKPGLSLEQVALHASASDGFDEKWLQQLIHESPSCLPISEIEPGLVAPFVSICREMPTPHGPVDNLLMTRDGDIAIVETKLFRNPEARRKVVAQALDYAMAIFAMDYSTFEKAAVTHAENPKPKSLYRALSGGMQEGEGPEQQSEDVFVDAVVRNLRKGRALILIVGDGIRSETELLLDGLQNYARFQFTLALIELAVFRLPDSEQLLVTPRTLAKTAIVGRHVIDLVSGEVRSDRVSARTETLSSEKYWEALEQKIPGVRPAIEQLIESAKPFGVYEEFLGSLNLKWERPEGEKPLNLGYIQKNGAIWTEAAAWTIPPQLAKRYVEEVASVLGCEVTMRPNGTSWTLTRAGRPIRLNDKGILDRLPAWPPVMGRLIEEVAKLDKG